MHWFRGAQNITIFGSLGPTWFSNLCNNYFNILNFIENSYFYAIFQYSWQVREFRMKLTFIPDVSLLQLNEFPRLDDVCFIKMLVPSRALNYLSGDGAHTHLQSCDAAAVSAGAWRERRLARVAPAAASLWSQHGASPQLRALVEHLLRAESDHGWHARPWGHGAGTGRR